MWMVPLFLTETLRQLRQIINITLPLQGLSVLYKVRDTRWRHNARRWNSHRPSSDRSSGENCILQINSKHKSPHSVIEWKLHYVFSYFEFLPSLGRGYWRLSPFLLQNLSITISWSNIYTLLLYALLQQTVQAVADSHQIHITGQ